MNLSKLPSQLRVYSTLGDNHSALERALEVSLSLQTFKGDSLYPGLLNANSTPEHALAYLAAERQLPFWETGDSDGVKRSLTSNAWQLRRTAGTRAGIKLALDSFDYVGEVTPWHKMKPRGEPYSFSVVAWKKRNQAVEPNAVHQLVANLAHFTSERDTYDLVLAHGLESGFRVSGASQPGLSYQDKSLFGELGIAPELSSRLSSSAALHNTIISNTFLAGGRFESSCNGSVCLAGAHSCTVISDLNLGVPNE
ncbi:phage tail protein I [Pseudoalteromonas rubra]|uniref:phage tail protein I n=1 Tax=Pseudoalteromonas rubra TaxID=43658 RepID=UPI0013DE3A88|nr:phage tail protein I [Pseudoalteromonas rubra]